MSRNNEERSGARQAADAPPSKMVSENEASPLDFTTPTEFVDLPSGGTYYPEDHPLHGKDSIEIRFMTAKDEDILTSKSLLKKGLAIDRLLQNIIVDKSIKLGDLLIGDKNALVVASRITGYGSDYITKVTCPACAAVQEYQFDLDASVHNIGGSHPDATEAEAGTWMVTCPKSDVQVTLGLLTGQDEKIMLQSQQRRKKQKLPETAATEQLKLIIKSVAGNADALAINKFVNVMPAQDARHLRSTYEALMPNINLDQDFECVECGFDMEMEVPFTTDFFWPKQ
jgi:hypothetical protein